MEVIAVNGDHIRSARADVMDEDSSVEESQPSPEDGGAPGQEDQDQEMVTMESIPMDSSTIDINDMESIRSEAGVRHFHTTTEMPDINQHIKHEHNMSAAGQVYGQVEEAEIERFLQEHRPTSNDLNRRDIKVSELRRIIPLLLIKQFNIRKDPTQKKVKGMWNERPKNWPRDVPYCDPNNTLKGEKGKPSQKILLRMFSYLVRLYMESQGLEYPEQAEAEPPRHMLNLTASGSPVAMAAAVDSNAHWVKMEGGNNLVAGNDVMVLGTNRYVPMEQVDSVQGPVQHVSPGTITALVSAASAPPVTTSTVSAEFGVGSDHIQQPRLQALLQSAGAQTNKARHKTPTVRDLVPVSAPQTLQQTIIIKPPPHVVNAQGVLVGDQPGALVNSYQVHQAMQALQGGQNYLIQSLPVLTQSPVSSAAQVSSRLNSPFTQSSVVEAQARMPAPQITTIPTASQGVAVSAPKPMPSSPLPVDTDPLSMLSATAAKKKPLPVPLSSDTSEHEQQPRGTFAPAPPASQLHVIQPATSRQHHEDMDTGNQVGASVQTTDEEDWDPFVELRQQCNKKLRFLEQKRLIDATISARLNIIKDLIDKMYMVRQHDPEFFISTAHEFISTLDYIKATGKVPESHMTKWREFEGYGKERFFAWVAEAYQQALNRLTERNMAKQSLLTEGSRGKTMHVINEEEVPSNKPNNEPSNSNNSTVNLEQLGIRQVTVGTVEQLQKEGGELNLRIVLDKQQQQQQQLTEEIANPEVEAIKKDLKLYDEELSSPRPSIEAPHRSPLKSVTSSDGGGTSEQNLEDLEQVLIMDRLTEAITRQEPGISASDTADQVSSTLYVATDGVDEDAGPLMDYRTPSMVLSPGAQTLTDMPSNQNPFPVTSNDGQPVEPHWTQLNVQPPGGSSSYRSTSSQEGSNSIAAELMEKIAAQNVSEKGVSESAETESQESFDRQLQGMRRLATAYINLQVAGDAPTSKETDQEVPQQYPGPSFVGTVGTVDEVQNVFEKSDMLGPPPAKRPAKRLRSGELVY